MTFGRRTRDPAPVDRIIAALEDVVERMTFMMSDEYSTGPDALDVQPSQRATLEKLTNLCGIAVDNLNHIRRKIVSGSTGLEEIGDDLENYQRLRDASQDAVQDIVVHGIAKAAFKSSGLI